MGEGGRRFKLYPDYRPASARRCGAVRFMTYERRRLPQGRPEPVSCYLRRPPPGQRCPRPFVRPPRRAAQGTTLEQSSRARASRPTVLALRDGHLSRPTYRRYLKHSLLIREAVGSRRRRARGDGGAARGRYDGRLSPRIRAAPCPAATCRAAAADDAGEASRQAGTSPTCNAGAPSTAPPSRLRHAAPAAAGTASVAGSHVRSRGDVGKRR